MTWVIVLENNIYKRSRFMYILEAAFEYLISILVSGSFLATLTSELGVSDGLTGIISSFISLGCVFQLLSMFIRSGRMKPLVIILSVLNQLLFMLLYIIPLTSTLYSTRIMLFVVAIFASYFIYNIAHPKKINWFMSTVDDSIRGRFTANKEIVSLILGVVFSIGMGAVVDKFKAQGNIRTAFIVCAIVIFVLMLLHTITMLLSVERCETAKEGKNIFKGMASVIKDKNVIKVAMVFVLWNIAHYCATPFYGTYQIKELGFSLTLVSVLHMAGSISRVLISRFWGNLADKKSFAVMIRVCFFVVAAGFLTSTFAVPANGKILFTVYYLCYSAAQGGINSALINLVFDYVPVERRADSLAISQALSGLAGFFATLCISPLVTHIQQNGNRLLGIPVYAQQVTSFIAFVFTLVAIIYISIFMIKRSKHDT